MPKHAPLLGKSLISQCLLVFFAFLLMILISNYFAGNIVTIQLTDYGEEVITASAETLHTYFEAHQVALEDVVFLIEELYENGAAIDEISEELLRWNTRLHSNDARYRDFLYIYGVIDGQFVQGSDWDVPDDFVPSSRPWYIGAYENMGRTYYSDPYIDAQTGGWIMSLSKVLWDTDGNDFGVLAFDIFFSSITDYVSGLHLMNRGYGALLDSEMRVIVHPDEELHGVRLDDIQGDKATLLRENDNINAYDYISPDGMRSVFFSRKLFNGWYLYMASPYDDYYKDVRYMFAALSLTGLAATVALCGILILMHRANEHSFAKAAAADEARERAASMLDATPFGCKMWDEDLNIFDCNQEAVNLFKVRDKDEFIERFFEFSPEYQPDGMLSSEKAAVYVRKAFKEKRLVFEWMHQLADETPIPTEVTLVRVNYGKEIAVAGYIRDLREYKKMSMEIESALDEARAASAAKSDFLSNMSHEIRTPMNAVLGMAELLLHESLTERQRDYANDIHKAGKSLLTIINDILDMSKIESGKLELQPVNYNFHAFLDNIHSIFTYIAEKKGITFSCEYARDLPMYMYGDDARLRQVLTNICANAVKFTKEGYVKLNVVKTNDQVVFTVKDTGIGIKNEDMDKLFNAFSQVDTHKNRNIVGTGLGLAISKTFAEMMGGGITLESEYGKGTVFTVTLPVTEGKAENRRKNENKHFTAPDAKVLVVDDNEFNRTVAGGLLNLSAIDADMAASGAEAIEMIKKKTYDIVFMDHMMPEMDGMETTEAIRKLSGAYEELIIIALTANAVAGAKEMYLTNGFNGFLPKPIVVRELNTVLTAWLPAEKIRRDAESEEKITDVEDVFLSKLESVSEIDVQTGLSRVEGDKGLYHITVELFYNSLLSECETNKSLLESGDIPGFATGIHAMKSILSTVGAMRLSEMALNLETAAKKGEADFCRSQYPPLHELLMKLHNDLKLFV